MPINKTIFERKTKESFFIGLTFSHLHYSIIERVCNVISANFAVSLCLKIASHSHWIAL